MKNNLISTLRFVTVVCVLATMFILYKENQKLKKEIEQLKSRYEKNQL